MRRPSCSPYVDVERGNLDPHVCRIDGGTQGVKTHHDVVGLHRPAVIARKAPRACSLNSDSSGAAVLVVGCSTTVRAQGHGRLRRGDRRFRKCGQLGLVPLSGRQVLLRSPELLLHCRTRLQGSLPLPVERGAGSRLYGLRGLGHQQPNLLTSPAVVGRLEGIKHSHEVALGILRDVLPAPNARAWRGRPVALSGRSPIKCQECTGGTSGNSPPPLRDPRHRKAAGRELRVLGPPPRRPRGGALAPGLLGTLRPLGGLGPGTRPHGLHLPQPARRFARPAQHAGRLQLEQLAAGSSVL
mmetsp:Transcript_148794/g.414554  ORF Transcript_148794/g.414554 Transcript_148794/m.414554 type:complete len:298 (-) Transcript_148794:205-1098(-)